MLAVEVSPEPLVGGVQGMCHNRDLHPPFRKVQSSASFLECGELYLNVFVRKPDLDRAKAGLGGSFL